MGQKRKKKPTKLPIFTVGDFNSGPLGINGAHTIQSYCIQEARELQYQTPIPLIYWLNNNSNRALISWYFWPVAWVAKQALEGRENVQACVLRSGKSKGIWSGQQLLPSLIVSTVFH